MTVSISNGIVILLIFIQNTFAQQGVYNAVSQPKATSNNAGVNFNSAQPGQQINNWQQPSNMQLAPVSQQTQNSEQAKMGFQVKQQGQNTLSDLFSALQGMRFSSQQSQGINPTASSTYTQTVDQATQQQNWPAPGSNNPQIIQYASQGPESPKPTFTFQFVPVSPQNTAPENQAQNSVPALFITNDQAKMASPAGPSYYIQNQPTNGMASQQVPTMQSFQTSSTQSQPILFAVNSQQPTGPNQPVVYTMQSTQPMPQSGNQNANQYALPNTASDNSMAQLMYQLQSQSTNPDIAALLPMLMSSKPEKSSGIKALLPLILSLLSDKGCGCPHCGCPYNNPEPVINGGYSNQMNYSQLGNNIGKTPEPVRFDKNIEESNKVELVRAPKKYKTNVISEISEETSDEDDDYEDDED